MNDFSEQLHRSARRLRERRNAGLDVPPCPQPRRHRLARRLDAVAAACVGLLVGTVVAWREGDATPELMARVDTVVVERLVRDTVVREVPAGLSGKTIAATGNPNAATGNPDVATGFSGAAAGTPAMSSAGCVASVVRAEPVAPPSVALSDVPPVPLSDYARYVAPVGRSVRDDSVDYDLFVSL